jgi:hypothetical protein
MSNTDGKSLATQDSHVAPWPISLGPGQRRTAVRGGVLLHFASRDSNELLAATDRILAWRRSGVTPARSWRGSVLVGKAAMTLPIGLSCHVI